MNKRWTRICLLLAPCSTGRSAAQAGSLAGGRGGQAPLTPGAGAQLDGAGHAPWAGGVDSQRFVRFLHGQAASTACQDLRILCRVGARHPRHRHSTNWNHKTRNQFVPLSVRQNSDPTAKQKLMSLYIQYCAIYLIYLKNTLSDYRLTL